MRNYSVNWVLRVLIVASFPMVTALSHFAFAGEANGYVIYVSNERSNDVTIVDGATDTVIAMIPVGKRPRGIHASPDGRRIYVVLSGSPRMAPGVDENR